VIVIDTHVWVWWVEDNPKLRATVRARLDGEDDVRVSAISLLGIATASSVGRMALRLDPARWLEVAQSIEQVTVEPLSAALCLASVSSPAPSTATRLTA
jgi:PIN domain nuclease of toxin-antitoxin system